MAEAREGLPGGSWLASCTVPWGRVREEARRQPWILTNACLADSSCAAELLQGKQLVLNERLDMQAIHSSQHLQPDESGLQSQAASIHMTRLDSSKQHLL